MPHGARGPRQSAGMVGLSSQITPGGDSAGSGLEEAGALCTRLFLGQGWASQLAGWLARVEVAIRTQSPLPGLSPQVPGLL